MRQQRKLSEIKVLALRNGIRDSQNGSISLFRVRFIKLLSDYPSVDTAAMGFPHERWHQELLWQTNVKQKKG